MTDTIIPSEVVSNNGHGNEDRPTTAKTALEMALHYHKVGYAPIDIPHRAKNPNRPAWQDERLSVDELTKRFDGKSRNVGILLGDPSGGLVDVDLDVPEARKLAPYFLPDTAAVFGRAGTPQSHRMYVAEPLVPTKKYQAPDGTMLLELRSTGCQTVVPPSVHEDTGEIIQWVGPLADAKPEVLHGESLRSITDELAAATLLARSWPSKGARHQMSLALAGGLLRYRDAKWVEDFIKLVAWAAGDEEFKDRSKDVKTTADKLEQGEPVTGWLQVVELIGNERVVDKVREWLNASDTARLALGQNTLAETTGNTEIRTVGGGEINEVNTKEWPEPPGQDAYVGLAGRFVDLASRHSEADPVALLGTFLTMFGCAVGPGPYLHVGATVHQPRLFLALAGRSGKARKGDSMTPARVLFRLADPEWEAHRISSGLSSGEGLIFAVRDRAEREQPVRGQPGVFETVVVDEGVEDKRLLAIEPEFERVLQAMGRQGNTLSSVLRDAWDRDTLSVLTKQPIRATGAYISLVVHVTIEGLRRELTATEAANGFGNRYIWLLVRRSQELPRPRPFAGPEVEALADELANTLEFARSVRRMDFDEEAGQIWDESYHELSKERDGLVWSILGRAEPQVLRLSMVYALLDHSPVVRADHLVSALDLWAYSERSAKYIFGDATGDPTADAILRSLRQIGSAGMSRTAISDLFGRNVSASRLSVALVRLHSSGLVRMERVEPEGGKGRHIEMWYDQ